MSPTAGIAALMTAAALLLPGCSSEPETIADSDVPQIAGLDNRHLSGLERDGDTLVAARALYRGPMTDPNPVATATIDRFTSRGWTLAQKRIAPTSASLLFEKDGREAQVDLKANQLNPAMGAGVLDLRRHGAAPPPAAPAAPGATPPAAPPSATAPEAPVSPAGGTS